LDTPPLSERREFEQAIMELYRAEYMADGTANAAIEDD
jgi:hypothetical protein